MSIDIKNNKFCKVIHNILNSGIKCSDSFSEIKLVRLINVFGLVIAFYHLFMGVITLFNHEYSLAIFDFTICILFILNIYLLSQTKKINLSADIIIFLLILTFVFLCFNGGYNGTGPMWSLVLPPIALQLRGSKKGSIYVLVFLTLLIFIIFVLSRFHLVYDYSKNFINPSAVGLRLILIYLAIFIASFTFTKNKQELILENERLSLTDTLTNLPNRRKINETLILFLEKFKRNNFSDSRAPLKLADNKKLYSFGLIICDIDNFKYINDTYGHPVGDIALMQISDFLVKNLRMIDFVGRWGGEEFLIILDETDLKGTVEVAEKLKTTIEGHIFKFDKIKVSITMSFGVSCFNDMQDINMFISKIDGYLIKAKRRGKNCIVYE